MTLKLAMAGAVIVFVSHLSSPQPGTSLAMNQSSLSSTSQQMTTKQGAMKIVRDPATGNNLKESNDIIKENSSRAMLPTGVQVTSPSFVERPSDIEGGGMVIELNGHFNSHMRASKDPATSELHTHCNHDADS